MVRFLKRMYKPNSISKALRFLGPLKMNLEVTDLNNIYKYNILNYKSEYLKMKCFIHAEVTDINLTRNKTSQKSTLAA